jgi:dipeptidyl aminopeptidase/acylaminoacyl peptidase
VPALLAEDGIEVLSPNYKGSSGYGYRYEESGDLDERIREIIAVCRFAKNFRGKSRHVILMGTSYGSLLAAAVAVADPQDISGLLLVSMVPIGSSHPSLQNRSFPVFCFHGENDPLSPENAHAIVSSFFPLVALSSSQIVWQTVPREGHVFRHAKSWVDVYDALLKLISGVSAGSRTETPAE